MRVLIAAAITALLVGTAYAQMATPNINLIPELQSKTPEEKEQEAVQQKAYKDRCGKYRTPRRPPIRGAPCAAEPAKSAAPAKPRTKTGSTAN